jgi:hypothetical protein
LGLPIDYVYKGSSLLQVKNNAVLTIEPGVTIQFTNVGGGIEITDGATIQAVGLPKLLDAQGNVITISGVELDGHIKFIGVGTNKGSWGRIDINTSTDNQFAYCDFINGGGDAGKCAVRCWTSSTQIGMSHCSISGSLGWGLVMYENNRITAFDNNKIENCDDVPVWIRGELKMLEKFDMTSDFTNNPKQYIQVHPAQTHAQDATINQTSVPYYFDGSTDYLNSLLTINEGVTIYMGDGVSLTGNGAIGQGRLMINGTASKKVKFTRLPGTTQYWNSVFFRGLTGSVVNHCIFEYGGKSNDYGIIWIADNADLTLSNVEINNSYNYGVYLGFGGCNYRLQHSNVTFADNYKGNVHNYCNSPNTVDEQLP